MLDLDRIAWACAPGVVRPTPAARSSPDSPQEGGGIEPSVPRRGSDKSCSMSRNLLYFLRETEGSNLSPSNRESMSRGNSPSHVERPGSSAGVRGVVVKNGMARRYCTDIFADRAGGKSAKAFLAELEFKAAEFEWVCGQSLVRTYEAPVRRTPPGYVRASADSGSGHHPLSLPGPLTAIPEFGHSATSSSTSKPLG